MRQPPPFPWRTVPAGAPGSSHSPRAAESVPGVPREPATRRQLCSLSGHHAGTQHRCRRRAGVLHPLEASGPCAGQQGHRREGDTGQTVHRATANTADAWTPRRQTHPASRDEHHIAAAAPRVRAPPTGSSSAAGHDAARSLSRRGTAAQLPFSQGCPRLQAGEPRHGGRTF